MYKSLFTHIVALLFTAVFLLPRVTSLHALTHLEEEGKTTSCKLCDTISISSDADVFSGNSHCFEVTSQNIPSSIVVKTQYNVPRETIVSPTTIHNKPPPFC